MIRFNQSTEPAGTAPFLGLTDANITVTLLDANAATERIQIAIVDYQYHLFSPFLAKTFTNNRAFLETLPTEYRP